MKLRFKSPAVVFREFTTAFRLQHLPGSVDHFYFDRTDSDDRLFDELARFRVRLLSVTHAQLSNTISDQLGAMQTIEQLDLGSNNIGDPAAPAIAKLHNLFMLSLSSTEFSDDGVALIARANLPLQQIHLANCKVSDRSLAEVANITSLRELGLDYCRRITDHGFGEIAALQNLEIIRFEHTQISQDAALNALSQLPNLREVFAKGTPKIDLARLQESLGPNVAVHQE